MKLWTTSRLTDPDAGSGREGWFTVWRGCHKSAALPNAAFAVQHNRGVITMSRYIAGAWVEVDLDGDGNVEVRHGRTQETCEYVSGVPMGPVS